MLETLSSLVRETRSMLWITDTADIYTYSYRPFTYTSCFQLDTKTGMHSRKGCVPLVKIPTTGTLALTVRRLALPRSSLLLPTSYVACARDASFRHLGATHLRQRCTRTSFSKWDCAGSRWPDRGHGLQSLFSREQ